MSEHIEDLEYDVRVQALYDLAQAMEIECIKAECYLKLAECQFHRGILALQVCIPNFYHSLGKFMTTCYFSLEIGLGLSCRLFPQEFLTRFACMSKPIL